MSDVEGVVENGVNDKTEDEFVDANEGNEEEQDPNLLKKKVKVEVTNEDGNVAVNGVAADDDRTEDQVPDITGTDNVDPMTTSMDGIEEIPTNEEAQEEPKEEDGGSDIPVEQFEDAPEEPAAAEEEPQAQEEEQSVEETPAEEPAAEEPTEETPAEETPAEEEPAAEEASADKPQEEEPAAEEEQATEEVPVEEEAALVEEEAPQEEENPAETEEQPAEEKPAEEGEEQPFELQAPPTPKRPRTPNDLDNVEKEGTPALSGQGSAVASQKGSVPATPRTPKTPSAVGDEAPGTPKSSFRGSQVGSQAASQAASQAGSQPGTPKPTSNAGSVPPTPRSGRGSIASEAPKASEQGSPRVATPRSSAPGTPKLDNGSAVGSPKGSGVGSAAATPRTGDTGTPRSKKAFDFDNVETASTPRTPKRTTFQDDNLSVARSPRTPRTPKSPKTPSVAESAEAPQEETPADDTPAEEPQSEEPAAETEEPQAEETVEEPKEEGEQQETPAAAEDETPGSPPPARAQSPSPSPRHRAQSPSPPPRRGRDAPSDYTPYDQDSHRETIPARMPTTTSFSSWNPPERSTYQPISPWVNSASKYTTEHTTGVSAHPTSTYTSIFDDLVSTGPFSHSLYATNRLLERSRSRTRERRQAFRSQRSASQYVRYTSQLPAPLRTREYSTPRSSSVSRVPGRYGSFTSFLDYSGAKQYELSRHGSRGSLYDSTQALSRSNSRGNIDFFLGAGRMSRVDSFVNNLNSRYEYQFPASHDIYHSASRGQISYAPLNQYQSYANYDNSYVGLSDHARLRRAARDVTPVQWKSMYEPFSNSIYATDPNTAIHAYGAGLPHLYGGFAKEWAGRL